MSIFQGKIIILNDNYPGEDEVYLITVYTGYNLDAGTTANVCIELHGSAGTSRVSRLLVIHEHQLCLIYM